MLRLTYTVVVRPAKLMDELLAAIPALQPVNMQPNLALESTATQCWITVPDSVPQSAVDAVVTAHDPTTPSAVEQQATNDSTSLSDLATTYAAMVTKLEAIAADMTTLGADANTLSTVTVSGTLAQTQATVQANLRALGTDLGTLVADVSALAAGSERVLKVARVFVRRGGS